MRGTIRLAFGFMLAFGSLRSGACAADHLIGPQASAAEIIAAHGNPVTTQLILQFERSTSKSPARTRVTVTIGPDYVQDADSEVARIFDFQLRRVFTLDLKSRAFVSVSLYSLAASRLAEAENRTMLRQAMMAAKVDEKQLPAALDPFWAESELSVISQTGGHPAIDITHGDSGALHFSYSGSKVADMLSASASYSDVERENFTRWLRQSSGLHPDIVATIRKSNRLPEVLSYRRIAGNEQFTVEYHLVSTDRKRAVYPLPATAKVELVAHGETSPEAAALRALTPTMLAAVAGAFDPRPMSASQYHNAIDDAMERKHLLTAALLMFESVLQYGPASTTCRPADSGRHCFSAQEVSAAAREDPQASAFSEAMEAEQNDPVRAATLLRSLARDQVPNPYVLDVAIANDLLTAVAKGEDRKASIAHQHEAFDLLQNGIRSNPYLAPYYKDLGDYFMRMYRTDLAWLCFDLGRALPGRYSPSILDFIDRYEQQLLHAAPDLF